jgi:hypothetical protein
MPDNSVFPEGLTALTVVAFAVSQVVAAFWPDIRRWPETITTRSNALDNQVVPAGPTFAIWGLIFAWCMAFAVWQALPAQRGNDLLRVVAPLAAALFFFNTLWEMWVPRKGLNWGSLAIILIEVSLSLWIVVVITVYPRTLTMAELWLVKAPLLVFGGWASAATFVNIASTMVWAQLRLDPRESVVSLWILAAAIGLGSAVSIASASFFYATPVAWALAGIAISARGKAERADTQRLALLAIPLVLVSALAGQWLR